MKSTLTFLMITLFYSLQLAAQNHKEYYPNGNLKEIGDLDKSKHIGDWKYYHENGQLSAEGKYDLNGKILIGTWSTYNDKGVKDGCDCPSPTQGDINELCAKIYKKEIAPDDTELSYAYQQTLWRISCAKDGVDSLETARVKIQKMWLKNRERFSCDLPGVKVERGNVTKLSVETGFTDFLIDVVKDYKLDLNFIDPADNKTILDFIKSEIKLWKESTVDLNDKIREHERLYDLLRKNGAKHANEL